MGCECGICTKNIGIQTNFTYALRKTQTDLALTCAHIISARRLRGSHNFLESYTLPYFAYILIN